jgi:hypothetical protein
VDFAGVSELQGVQRGACNHLAAAALPLCAGCLPPCPDTPSTHRSLGLTGLFQNPGASADDKMFYRRMEAAAVDEAIGVVALSHRDAAFITHHFNAGHPPRPIKVHARPLVSTIVGGVDSVLDAAQLQAATGDSPAYLGSSRRRCCRRFGRTCTSARRRRQRRASAVVAEARR